MKMNEKYKLVDLFAGAGGMSSGFLQTDKFDVVAVVENNEQALKTYRKNHCQNKKIIEKRDITDIDFIAFSQELGEVDVIIGGPPCQGFSNANRQHNSLISLNNLLVKKYVEAILSLKPKAFVMENVPMLSSPVHKFFDSRRDHDEILKLGVEFADETLMINADNFDGKDMLNLLLDKSEVQKFIVAKKDLMVLKLLKRHLGNATKLANIISKYSGQLETLLAYYKELLLKETDTDVTTKLKMYINFLINGTRSGFTNKTEREALNEYVNFIKSLFLITELDNCEIIYELSIDDNNNIKADVRTYTVIEYIKKKLSTHYKIKEDILNAVDFGVPQERRRFFMIGVIKEIAPDQEIVPPKGRVNRITVKEAIEDLEQYKPGFIVDCSGDEFIERSKLETDTNKYVYKMQKGLNRIYNHVTTKSTPEALKRFRALKPGQNFHNLEKELIATYKDGSRTQNTIYLKLEYDKPCGTVVNVRKSMWIHPTLSRAISIREAARLQSFPDDFIFCGTKDQQYQQIGNAVPPLLAKEIALKIDELLSKSNFK